MYALVQNDVVVAYPYSADRLRSDNPDTSFPAQIPDALLAEFGVLPVASVLAPAYDSVTQILAEETPELVDGVWTQRWTVTAATSEQIEARALQIRDDITTRVQARLDGFARTRGYDGIVSACSYATSSHPRYGPEGRYCVQAREETWDVLFSIEAQVTAGTRPLPRSYEEIELELPALAWPG